MAENEMPTVRIRNVAALLLCALPWTVAVRAEGKPIAGVARDRRPAAAPTVRVYVKDAAWYSAALRGVEQPYPASLRFLEDQGAWFTPFLRPGMTGPYDIRGWHAPPGPRSGSSGSK